MHEIQQEVDLDESFDVDIEDLEELDRDIDKIIDGNGQLAVGTTIEVEAFDNSSQEEITSAYPPRLKKQKGVSWVHGDNTDDLTQIYLNEVGRYPLLDKEQEQELAKTIERGKAATERLKSDEELSRSETRALRREVREAAQARETFINSNLRLVVSMAKRYQASGLPLLDIIQEGNLGLERAVEKFEWRKGFKFSTYASWWIRQSIQRGILNSADMIRVPVHTNDAIIAMKRAKHKLASTLGRSPSNEELAEELGSSPEKVAEIKSYAEVNGDMVSLDETIFENEVPQSSTVDDPDAERQFQLVEDHVSMATNIQQAMQYLNPLENTILSLTYGLDGSEPMNSKEVASELNLVDTTVRNIIKRARAKLLHPSMSIDLRSLLDN